MWKTIVEEAREVVWLVAIVGGLSAASVGVAAMLAVA